MLSPQPRSLNTPPSGTDATRFKRLQTMMDAGIRVPPIPYELLRLVVENLAGDKMALRIVSLVSSTFREEGQRMLFRDATNLHMYIANIKFLRTVAASPDRLALFVHAYQQGILSMLDEEVAEKALKAMRNLKHLDMASASSYSNCRKMLQGCTFKLERFEWNEHLGNGDEILGQFLAGQNTLKHLSISCSHKAIQANICPQLVFVKGYSSMISALLPGRKITTLYIYDSIIISAGSTNPFALELTYVKTLSVSLHSISSSHLDQQVLPHFPCLTILEIRDLEANEELFSLDEGSSFFEVLSKLSSLQTLQVILTEDDEMEETFEAEKLQFTRRLFDKFGKNLTSIVIQADWETLTRYTQNGTEEISEREARKVWLAG